MTAHAKRKTNTKSENHLQAASMRSSLPCPAILTVTAAPFLPTSLSYYVAVFPPVVGALQMPTIRPPRRFHWMTRRRSGEEDAEKSTRLLSDDDDEFLHRLSIFPEPRARGTRRSFFDAAGWGTAASAASFAAFASVPPAAAATKGAKGAAELDLEYYVRDILKGNAREGPVSASSQPPSPPPRSLRGNFVPLLLDDAFSSNCVPCRTLAEISGRPPSVVSELAESYRAKSARSFAVSRKWEEESVKDQYYFDLSSYALWKTASDLIPDYRKRDEFARDVGRGLYREALASGLLKAGRDANDATIDGRKLNGPLTGTIPAVQEILDLFNNTEFCSSYRIGEKGDETRTGRFVFDEYDDDDFENGLSVNCLISVFRPANLGSSLQITGEGSRFSPDYVGSTISAMWEEKGVACSYESYFVDPVYRPNPKDFFPDEQLLQFTLTKKKK